MKDNTTGGEGLREAVLSVLDFHQIRKKLSDDEQTMGYFVLAAVLAA
jgi:hypothetical protein